MGSYWVQEDFPTRSARVHRANCRYCNNGRGWRPERTGRNNVWYGPFPSPEEARVACRQVVAQPCGTCMPDATHGSGPVDLNDRIRREQQADAAKTQSEQAHQQRAQAAEQRERTAMRQLGEQFVVWMTRSGIEPQVLQWRQEKKAFQKPRAIPMEHGWKLYPGPCGDVDCRVNDHTVIVRTDGLISAPRHSFTGPFTSEMFQDMVVRYATEHKISTPWQHNGS